MQIILWSKMYMCSISHLVKRCRNSELNIRLSINQCQLPLRLSILMEKGEDNCFHLSQSVSISLPAINRGKKTTPEVIQGNLTFLSILFYKKGKLNVFLHYWGKKKHGKEELCSSKIEGHQFSRTLYSPFHLESI